MTKSQVLTLAGFALLGGIVVWQSLRIGEIQDTNTALARSKPSTLQAVSPRPDGNGENPGPKPPPDGRGEPPGGNPQGSGRGNREAHFRKMREMDRKQRQDSRMLALTTKLNLTPEQQTAIRAALEKSSTEKDTLREAGETRRRSGTKDTEEVRRADMAKFAELDTLQEKTIAATLSAEQLAAYTEYQAEQKRTTVENKANQQLGDLLTRFSLTEDQKDAAFQVFAKQEEENSLEPSRVAAMGGDFVKLFEERQKAQLDSLKQILTPDQYELYKTQQEQRSATFRNMIPGEPPGRP